MKPISCHLCIDSKELERHFQNICIYNKSMVNTNVVFGIGKRIQSSRSQKMKNSKGQMYIAIIIIRSYYVVPASF